MSGLGSWTGSRFEQQVELGLGKPLGSTGAGRRGGRDLGDRNLRSDCSAMVPPQGGGRTPILVSMLFPPDIPVDKDIYLVLLWDRNVVMWEVGLCSSPGMAFGFWCG